PSGGDYWRSTASKRGRSPAAGRHRHRRGSTVQKSDPLVRPGSRGAIADDPAGRRTGGTTDMTWDECTEVLAQARLDAGLSYQEIADKLGRHVIWTAAALMGQCSLDEAEAGTLVDLLGIGGEERDGALVALQQPPTKGAVGTA